MDEWVCLPRIDTSKGPVEEGQKELETILELDGRERKVTRNLKRKHDEINHVQKVPHFRCTVPSVLFVLPIVQ